MAHQQTDSVESVLSEIAAAAYTDPEFQREAEAIRHASHLEQLVAQARKIINDFAPRDESIRTFSKKVIHLDRVMDAMLTHSEEAGGEKSTRYVASRIVACQGDVEKLAAVAFTWTTHLLYVFKSSHSHSNQANPDPSPIATPTIDHTRIVIDELPGSRGPTFRDDLLLRDGYRCVVSGIEDREHPSPTTVKRLYLEPAHIIRRAISDYDENHRSKSNKAAVATFDILINFTRLTEDQVARLSTLIDDPSNGMMLEKNIHEVFNKFEWCLQKTEVPNQYKLRDFVEGGSIHFFRDDVDAPVMFKNHSGSLHQPGGSSPKRDRDIPLPNPDFIRIHAAVAGILHMSGAGRFYDELLRKYKGDEGSTPLLTWMDLENAMALDKLESDVRHLVGVAA